MVFGPSEPPFFRKSPAVVVGGSTTGVTGGGGEEALGSSQRRALGDLRDFCFLPPPLLPTSTCCRMGGHPRLLHRRSWVGSDPGERRVRSLRCGPSPQTGWGPWSAARSSRFSLPRSHNMIDDRAAFLFRTVFLSGSQPAPVWCFPRRKRMYLGLQAIVLVSQRVRPSFDGGPDRSLAPPYALIFYCSAPFSSAPPRPPRDFLKVSTRGSA